MSSSSVPSRSRKVQRASPHPQRLAPLHQRQNDDKGSRADRRLDAKADLGALLLGPRNLEVGDDEAAKGTRVVDPGRHLARRLRVRVETITADGHRRDHDAVHIETPRDARGHVVPAALEALADEHEADDHERQREEDGAQAHLGLEVAAVRADVLPRDGVVEPVARQLGQDDSDDGREVEEADLLGAEAVEGRDEDGERRVDADDPGKGLGTRLVS